MGVLSLLFLFHKINLFNSIFGLFSSYVVFVFSDFLCSLAAELAIFLNCLRQLLSGYYLGALRFLNSLYLLITFFVLHKSRFSRLTLIYLTLFQLNGFFFFHSFIYVMKWIRSESKEQNQKKRDKPIKPGHEVIVHLVIEGHKIDF